MRFILTDFHSVPPPYEITQEHAIRWLTQIHFEAERSSLKKDPSFDSALRRKIEETVERYAWKPQTPARRRSAFRDFIHDDRKEMEIFSPRFGPHGAGAKERSLLYAREAASAFEALYREREDPPEDLVHVTCTGYVSPSAAQAYVNRRGWGAKTTVTHAYHMGCYAAFPALRIALSFLNLPPSVTGRDAPRRRVDIVHTELCTLHLDAASHDPEQIVIQSLFADGLIRYSAVSDLSESSNPRGGIEILALREEIFPDSLGDMTWIPSDWGMEMTLSKEVPFKVGSGIEGFLKGLFHSAELRFEAEKAGALFAIHPGGPRILDASQEFLNLQDEQMRFSREILFDHGNMSSATVPHIWEAIVKDPDVKPGTLIVGLAFGPGLTFCGGLFRKVKE